MNINGTIGKDLFNIFIGEQINYGMSRVVYNLELDKDKVIKFEQKASCFQNVIEWEIWNKDIQYSKYSKWFAPCYAISPCGVYLIQHKTQKIPKEEYPKKMPVFFNDFKYSNFGVIVENGKKRFVCHDYGIVKCIGNFTDRMKKVDWYDE